MASLAMCRMCAKPQTRSLQKLFDGKHASVLKKFEKLTGKTLIYDEDLPQYVCKCCLENLTRAYEFRANALVVQEYYTTSQYLDSILLANLDKKNDDVVECEEDNDDGDNDDDDDEDVDEDENDDEKDDDDYESENEDQDEQNVQIPKTFNSKGYSGIDDKEGAQVSTILNAIAKEDAEYEDEDNERISFPFTTQDDGETILENNLVVTAEELPILEDTIKTIEENKMATIKGVCQYCGKAFKFHGELGRHLRRHEGNKRFQCQYCEHKSDNRSDLQYHQMTHTGERPFPCSYCDKRFTSKHLMKRHVRIHENVRPFLCRYCDKGFSQASILKSHLISHGESRFNCTTCVRSFQSRSSMLKHYNSTGHIKKKQEASM